MQFILKEQNPSSVDTTYLHNLYKIFIRIPTLFGYLPVKDIQLLLLFRMPSMSNINNT